MSLVNLKIPEIAEFLLYLFKAKGLMLYCTAIADHLQAMKQVDISHNPELNRLLVSFHRDRPRALGKLPPWDLCLVLRMLTKSPYEPLGTADLKFVTHKTAFLVALASAKRRSELHAITKSSVRFSRDGNSVIMSQSPDFLAKNQFRTVPTV